MWSGSILSPVPSMDCAGDLGPDRCLSDPFRAVLLLAHEGPRPERGQGHAHRPGAGVRRRLTTSFQIGLAGTGDRGAYHEASDPGEQRLGFLA